MQYKAIHRFADMSARKIRPFATLIRNRVGRRGAGIAPLPAQQERPSAGAVVKSALGNAEDRGARNIEDLIVSESRVDGGPIMKRIMPRARGTAYPIKRRYAHIHVVLWDGEEEARTTAEAAAEVTSGERGASAP